MPRAVVGRPSCNNRASDRAAALRTAISLFAMLNEEARGIVRSSRFEGDRLLKNAANAAEQSFHFVVAQPIDGPARIDRRPIERLVRVQISDSSNHVLRQQQCLDPSTTLVEQDAKGAEIDLQWIGTEAALANVFVRRGSEVDDPEQAHVFIREVRAVLEIENHPREPRRLIDEVRQIAAHAEVDVQPDAVRIGKKMFPVPPRASKRMAGEPLDFSSAENAIIEHADASDCLSECVSLEVALVHLHFRQLGHGIILSWPEFRTSIRIPSSLASAPCSTRSEKNGVRRCSPI